jgi:hypothetical protein
LTQLQTLPYDQAAPKAAETLFSKV